jgi:hypothetical protein
VVLWFLLSFISAILFQTQGEIQAFLAFGVWGSGEAISVLPEVCWNGGLLTQATGSKLSWGLREAEVWTVNLKSLFWNRKWEKGFFFFFFFFRQREPGCGCGGEGEHKGTGGGHRVGVGG